MKHRLIVLAFLAFTSLSLTACGSWWSNFKSDPVAQVQTFQQSVQVALNIAQGVWNTLKPLLKPELQAAAQAKYDAGVLVVNKALYALNDAVNVAVETQQAHPDFLKLMADVSDAVAQVIAIVDEFKTMQVAQVAGDGGTLMVTKTVDPPGYNDLKSAHLQVKKFSVRHP